LLVSASLLTSSSFSIAGVPMILWPDDGRCWAATAAAGLRQTTPLLARRLSSASGSVL